MDALTAEELDLLPVWRFACDRRAAQKEAQRRGLRLCNDTFTLDDIINSMAEDDTPEGRLKLVALIQGRLEWKRKRSLKETASKAAESSGEGYVDPDNPPPPDVPGYNAYKDTSSKLADLLGHPLQFKSNAATRFGNLHEPDAIKTGVLRLRMQLRELGLPDMLRVVHQGMESEISHPWVGFSTDGNVSWVMLADGQEELIAETILEAKCPTYLYPSVRAYQWVQQQLELGMTGKLWADYLVWTPAVMTVLRVDFDPYYFNEQLLPRLQSRWIDMLVPAILHAENDGDIPDWLPAPSVGKEPPDPEVQYAAVLATLAALGTRVFVPEPDMGLPDPFEIWKWPASSDAAAAVAAAAPAPDAALPRERLSRLTEDCWDRAWKNDAILDCHFASHPFLFPLELSDLPEETAQLVRQAQEQMAAVTTDDDAVQGEEQGQGGDIASMPPAPLTSAMGPSEPTTKRRRLDKSAQFAKFNRFRQPPPTE